MSGDGDAKRNGTETAFAPYADCLDLLVRFHDRELDADFLAGIRDNAIGDWLGEILSSRQSRDAIVGLKQALASLPPAPGPADYDRLAAEYAEIYLTHGYRISPNGSVWLTEDHLERQAPMFEVRNWYRHYGVGVPDWRKRPDDHIAHQIQFLALLLRHQSPHAAGDAARFLDANLLKWLPDFTARVAQRCKSPIYRAAATLTAATVEEIRDILQTRAGVARPVPEPEPKRPARATRIPGSEQPYVPGQAESW
ncbi:MAG TPA: molecular chaperone TorD family protein [Rhizobiaceae bacterium]|nr:molecular chaperone TorD family protein [Rhizobiaceae bacterium]